MRWIHCIFYDVKLLAGVAFMGCDTAFICRFLCLIIITLEIMVKSVFFDVLVIIIQYYIYISRLVFIFTKSWQRSWDAVFMGRH